MFVWLSFDEPSFSIVKLTQSFLVQCVTLLGTVDTGGAELIFSETIWTTSTRFGPSRMINGSIVVLSWSIWSLKYGGLFSGAPLKCSSEALQRIRSPFSCCWLSSLLEKFSSVSGSRSSLNRPLSWEDGEVGKKSFPDCWSARGLVTGPWSWVLEGR